MVCRIGPDRKQKKLPDEIFSQHVQRVDVVPLRLDELPDAVVALLLRLEVGQQLVPEFLLRLARATAPSPIEAKI